MNTLSLGDDTPAGPLPRPFPPGSLSILSSFPFKKSLRGFLRSRPTFFLSGLPPQGFPLPTMILPEGPGPFFPASFYE